MKKDESFAYICLFTGVLSLWFVLTDYDDQYYLGGNTETITIVMSSEPTYLSRKNKIHTTVLRSTQYRNHFRLSNGAYDAMQEYKDLSFLHAGDTVTLQIPASQYQEVRQYSDPGPVRIVGLSYKGMKYLTPRSVKKEEANEFWIKLFISLGIFITGIILWVRERREKRTQSANATSIA